MINSVCLSADGQYVLSGAGTVPSWVTRREGYDDTLKLWDVATGKCLQMFQGHTHPVQSVCLSANGRYALSASKVGMLKLWDVGTGKCLRTFEGQEGEELACLSMEGHLILSYGNDGFKLMVVRLGVGRQQISRLG